jgi:hypothetical protein
MAAAGAIRCRHIPVASSEAPGISSGDAPRVVPLHCRGNQNCQQFAFIFVAVDSLLPTTIAK